MSARISVRRSMEAVTLTVGDYRALYEGLDDDVIVDTAVSQGDRPWESSSTRVSVNASRTQTSTNHSTEETN